MDLSKIPSPFYRVSVKAFVFDYQRRLLMGRAPDGVWEPPGGGLEYDESIEECLRRELQEELGVGLAALGGPIAIYRGTNIRGFEALKIAFEVKLSSLDFKYGDLANASFVTKDELLGLNMSHDESGIKDQVDKIWPSNN